MAEFQPEIMIVNGVNQNRHHTGKIPAQGVRIDLISHNCSLRSGNTISLQTLPDPSGAGLGRMGDAGNLIGFAEYLNPILVAVGHHAQLNTR